MSTPTALLSRLGVFLAEDFLEISQCREVAQEMRSATPEDAEVYTGDREELEQSLRRAKRLKPTRSVRRLLEDRLELLRPQLEKTFSFSLRGFEPPQLLAYGPGHFHQPHRDTSPDASEAIAQRKVSLVAFLNDQSEDPQDGCYGGGSLLLAGLLPGPGGDERAVPVAPPAGSAVAFRSDTAHEVTPVTHGERFTIVTWFY